ncbi:MAG: response regulator [Candidatus Latescibacteria bacterium]|nr:response regulator [Candidatus Latescibacterota bacterium]NIM66367.1 response regulator [Candidatus Latescibacterota bacterium]NIO02846.1 response regulator [Candidatus Latescibacterota bacterium]NIO29981.1 response regulator [Candidatus Latescibacterota bacterium]NIO57596.1 response regulator [Candidatus Latescibacterota bacterium]
MQQKSILVVDDEKGIRDTLEKSLKKENYNVLLAKDGHEGLDIINHDSVDVVLTDLKMPSLDGITFLKAVKQIDPDIEVVVMTGYGTIDSAVESLKAGAYDFIQKPFKKITIMRAVRKAVEKQSLITENKYLKRKLEELYGFKNIIGQSQGIRKIIEIIQQVAPSHAAVLIQGESGTGKEVIAHAIHYSGERRQKPFIKVSCAAIPETLLEAEIFGYERGAFTGAVAQKRGRFELAHGGSLFLDEIGEVSPFIQVKLLRVLQSGEFERLGGTETLKSNVRLIAATNANLQELIAQKKFREDLYYRLNVININIPPLRERKEDIPLLVAHFTDFFCKQNKKPIKGISEGAMELLKAHYWPGNIRELENAIARAVVLTKNDVLQPEDFPIAITKKEDPRSFVEIPFGMGMEDIEKLVIRETLKRTRGDKNMAAKLLGIASRTIYRKLKNDK